MQLDTKKEFDNLLANKAEFIKSLVFGLMINIAKARHSGGSARIEIAEHQFQIVSRNLIKQMVEKLEKQ